MLKITYVSETCDGRNDVGALVHDDDGTRSQTGLRILERIIIHPIP